MFLKIGCSTAKTETCFSALHQKKFSRLPQDCDSALEREEHPLLHPFKNKLAINSSINEHWAFSGL